MSTPIEYQELAARYEYIKAQRDDLHRDNAALTGERDQAARQLAQLRAALEEQCEKWEANIDLDPDAGDGKLIISGALYGAIGAIRGLLADNGGDGS